MVTNTITSLLGVEDLVRLICAEVVVPFKNRKYGPTSFASPPKMILFTGSVGIGKKSLSSAIVNELRLGESWTLTDKLNPRRTLLS